MKHKFKVDYEKCVKCGLCVKNCPTKALEYDEYKSPKMDKPKNCMKCQHCLAICPSGAISIMEKDPNQSAQVRQINSDDVLNLIQSRRSIRDYKQENVAKDTIQKLKDMLNFVPTGRNSHSLHFSFIEDIEVMGDFRTKVNKTLIEIFSKKTLQFLTKHFSNYEKIKNEIEKGNDIIFRGAPHMVVVNAPVNSSCPEQDGIIALSYFELYANSLGLGTCWCGYAYRIIKMFPNFSEYLQVPKGYKPIYVMLFGYKNIEYKRTIQPNPYSFTTVEKQEIETNALDRIKRFIWNIV